MRTLGTLIGAVLLAVGILWLLQEYNIVPGSFLVYEVSFAQRGLLATGLGIAIILAVNSGQSRR